MSMSILVELRSIKLGFTLFKMIRLFQLADANLGAYCVLRHHPRIIRHGYKRKFFMIFRIQDYASPPHLLTLPPQCAPFIAAFTLWNYRLRNMESLI